MEAVVQYAKSRPVFEGYKAARYSKKYLAEHGPELADYRAAKAALNELLDGEKLPKMDALKEKCSFLYFCSWYLVLVPVALRQAR